jgi:uncharacterized protein YlbG (UPF0298 family)
MTNLNFYGPINFMNIDKKGNIKEGNVNLNISGLYVWGFMYYFDGETIGQPVNSSEDNFEYDSNTMKFIPYYVGKSDSTTIYQRLKKHHNIRKGDAAKYIRLSLKYMKEFFKDSVFPIKFKRVQNNSAIADLISNSAGKIEYFNDPNCLKLIYPNINLNLSGRNNTDCPIPQQKNGTQDLPDSLAQLIEENNNFWFCYCDLPQNPSFTLENLETYAFWSLKGKTVSQAGQCPVPNNNITINDLSKTNIFKNQPSKTFLGY